jgi:CRISPR-associated protein Csd1
MIKELAEFGKRIRTGHDALKDEPISIDLIINADGSFSSFSIIEKIRRPAEALNSKKGKARLLLDKAEEVLNYVSERELKNAKNNLEIAKRSVASKHKLYIEKLEEYKELTILKPIFLFYNENRENGIDKALLEFENKVPEKEKDENIAFRVNDIRPHEHKIVYDAIIEKFELQQNEKLKGEKRNCSICGCSDYPITKETHGMIKNVPKGQKAGCAFVSYNENAFESYGLQKNLNSAICTNCAKNYVEGLNWLLTNGYIKGESPYTNRKNFGSDTAMIFWTKEEEQIDELNLLDNPDVGQISNLINSVANAKQKVAKGIKTNQFYSCTLSGAAARIAIRDWIEVSLEEYKQNIAKWFEDICIKSYDKDSKELRPIYVPLHILAWSCGRKESSDDPTISRVAKHLWNAALKKQALPLWILPTVLKRIAHNETTSEGKSINTFTPARASLIRIILNRNNYGGKIMLKEELDLENTSQAYLCGRLFALIEGIQRSALGKDINAGVRERFFSAASTSPSPAFGRLIRQMQNHLTKLKQDKAYLAKILDDEIRDLCGKIKAFPAVLTLEQQGQFALGYYHQKHYNFNRAKHNKEFETLTENLEE